MKPLVLFGSGKIADVLLYYWQHDSPRVVAACTVDREYMPAEGSWMGLPVVPFDEILEKYPPSEYDMFVALGYQNMNDLRRRKCEEARELGYALASFIHPQSGMPSDTVIGDNCFIMHNVMIHPRVTLGNNVYVWSGAMIGHHSVIEDDCWLTSCCNVSGVVRLGRGSFLAVNATVGQGVRIGERNFLGANTLIVKDTPDDAACVQESSKPIRLTSAQFVRMSGFGRI